MLLIIQLFYLDTKRTLWTNG